ncbi:MAG: M23 family metallopeptidase [Acidimicrobiales bacterium]
MSQAPLPRSRPHRLVATAAIVVLAVAMVGCAPSPKSKKGKTTKPPAPTTTLPPVGPPTRSIVFPLAKMISYSDTFGAARSGGRSHEGQDLMSPKGTVAVAAVSGTVTSLRHDSSGLSGNSLRITDAEGWQYVYIHVNNDTPGTDDGANVYEQAFVDGIRVGQKVVAGEPVAYVGDSGNAESTGPHLHFEIHSPDGAAVNAYSSLRAAPVSVLSADQMAAAAPGGSVDGLVVAGPGAVRAAGWALDRVTDAAVPVSIYVDGNPATTTPASLVRPDVAAAFPTRTGNHGYDITVPGIAAGAHRVCVIFHNAGAGGGSTRAGCADLAVP